MTGLFSFLSDKLLNTILIWALWTVFVSKVQSAEKLLQIELIEEKQNITLSIDGSCLINGSSGALPKYSFQSTWHQLTIDLDISQLTRIDINRDINQQMKRIGIVVIEDGAQLITLKLKMDKEVRQIDIYGLIGLINNYPKAKSLVKFNNAILLLKNVSNYCLVNDK